MTTQVLIVGGGFGGLGCARRLAKREDVHVTLIDRNNYHQFQPLLYQVATSQLGPSNVAFSLRKVFRNEPNIDIKLAEIAAIDPGTKTVTATDGQTWSADVLVIAAGARANFFGTPGAEEHSYPLYSLRDAERLRSRIIGVFEAADRDPALIARGALEFVIVGGGATGVEVAGALADMVNDTMPAEYLDLPVDATNIHVVELGHALLAPFSGRGHEYAAKVLRGKGVTLHLGVGVEEIGAGHAKLSDGTVIPTRCVIWGGGIQGASLLSACGLAQGRGGRLDVDEDLLAAPGVYAVGDAANIMGLPQLGSVALQSGEHAAENILAGLEGRRGARFEYRDKGIMAMIGRGAAIAAGPHRRELHGRLAFAAWLGVHAMLMTGVRTRAEAVMDWGWDYFSRTRGPQVLDRAEAAEIDWADDPVEALG
jgi:NADH:ubiquinone reductase (H+-translocating)